MEKYFSCLVCFNSFDENNVIPRVPDCGHTICSDCLSKILQEAQPLCPKCRGALSKKNTLDYPINFTVLSIIDSGYKSPSMQTQFLQKVKVLKGKYEDFHSANVMTVATAITTLKNILDQENQNPESNKTFLYLEKEFNCIYSRNARMHHDLLKQSMTLKLDGAKNIMKDFVLQIYKVAVSEKKIYAVTIIDGIANYALIDVVSCSGSQMMLHAFGEKPQDDNIATVWFQDFKLSLGEEVKAFLEIIYNDSGMRYRIVINSVDSSLVNQFMKFCTGELGPSFKGCEYNMIDSSASSNVKQNIMKINRLNVVGERVTEDVDYKTVSSSKKYCHSLILLELDMDDYNLFRPIRAHNSCDHKYYDNEYKNVIGLVETPENFLKFRFDSTKGVTPLIVDSGIIYRISF